MLEYRTSFPAFGQVVSERYRKDARPVEPTSASAATPSPLNGERAGVRGEDTRDLPCNKLTCARCSSVLFDFMASRVGFVLGAATAPRHSYGRPEAGCPVVEANCLRKSSTARR